MLDSRSFRSLTIQAADRFGDRPFMIADELLGRITYHDVLRFARGLERELDALNVPIGAPVATIFHNCGLAALYFIAVIAARRIFVPLNPISTPEEVSYMLNRAECQAVVLDPAHTRATELGERKVRVVRNHVDHYRALCAQTDGGEVGSTHSTHAFCGEVVYTSGSTGRPKGVLLSEESLLANASALAQVYEFRSQDRFLTVCPLFHNSGQILTTLGCALVGGSTVAVKSDIGMLRFWHYVEKYSANWSLGMVSFLAMLLHGKDRPPLKPPLRGLLTGGSAIDAGLVKSFESRFGVPVRTVYGLTESSSIATCEFLDPNPRSLGSSGRVLPGCDVAIGPDPSRLARADDPRSRERGEIWISGPTVFERYIGDPALTDFRKQQGWLRTGDLGYFDEHGNLFVVDRSDSMLIVGGENVYPAEIERLCSDLPHAAQVVLAGVDHPIWGKQLVLVYRTEEGVSAPTTQWHRILVERVAAFKVPQRYVSVQELGFTDFPRKENGKLDRPGIAAALNTWKKSTVRNQEAV